MTVAETLPTVSINAIDGNNVINNTQAHAGVALSGTVSGLAGNSTFQVTVTDAGFNKSYTATVNGVVDRTAGAQTVAPGGQMPETSLVPTKSILVARCGTHAMIFRQ